MRLVKVHHAIRFKSSPYDAGYIANNTEKRQLFKHDNEKKACSKLLNNAPAGKTIENVARRIDIKLLNDMEKAQTFREAALSRSPGVLWPYGAAEGAGGGRGRRGASTA